jgi:outer membrane protein OmpA-like peptidoglycan-associated protein
MNPDLLDMFNATFGGPVIRQASAFIGESEDSARTAVRSVGPALLAGLMQRMASPKGISEIFPIVTSDAVDAGIGGKLSGVLANRGTLGSLLTSGDTLSGMVLGSQTDAVATAIAAKSGVRPNSAMTLLSLGAPLLLGMLKKFVANTDLDASALASLVMRQKDSLKRSGLDDHIARALGADSRDALLDSLPGKTAATPAIAPAQSPRDKPWMPWAIAAGIAVFGVLFLVNRTSEYQEAPDGAVQIAEVADSSDRLHVATAEDSAQVHFESDDASIGQDDRRRIADMATSVRDTEQSLGITGYTDRAGDQDRNLELAADRTQAVREALVSEGIREDRIVMDPPRSVTGAGTDEEASRVDIDTR